MAHKNDASLKFGEIFALKYPDMHRSAADINIEQIKHGLMQYMLVAIGYILRDVILAVLKPSSIRASAAELSNVAYDFPM